MDAMKSFYANGAPGRLKTKVFFFPVGMTGTTTLGSPVVNFTGTSTTYGLAAGMAVEGSGGAIVSAQEILSVDSDTQITLSANADAAVVGATLTFSASATRIEWTAPADMLFVSACGAGGGGGGGHATGGGGGGGGAAESLHNYPMAVVAGETLTLLIGATAGGGAVGSAGTNGGMTSVARNDGLGVELEGRPRLPTIKGGFGGEAGGAADGGAGGDSGPTTVVGAGAAGGAAGTGATVGGNGERSMEWGTGFNSGAGGGGGGSTIATGGRGGFGFFVGSGAGTGVASGGGGGGGGFGQGGSGGASGVAGSAPTTTTLKNYGSGGGGGGQNAAGGGGAPAFIMFSWF